MSMFWEYASLDGIELPLRPLHLAIGMFDGVHLGHQAVIESAVRSARRGGGLAGVLTFYPHPSALFRPESPTRLLMPSGMKTKVLRELGVDFVIEQPFTREFAAVSPAGFLPYLQGRLPRLDTLYVGENWRFGRGREGDVAFLLAEARARHLNVVSMQRVNFDGSPISSTRIRAHLTEGEIESANRLLGYSYFSEGVVESGRRLGRTLGFPTLNLRWEPELLPRFGVYAVRAGDGHSPARAGVANYGLRPTVETGAPAPRLEVNLLEQSPFGYGDTLKVEWLTFLRPEQKFPSVEALREQIGRDRERAQAFFDKP